MSAVIHLATATVAKTGTTAFERHFTPRELGRTWGLHERTIRDLFRDEPGVLKIGETGRRTKRDHVTIRIPESVAARVYLRRTR